MEETFLQHALSGLKKKRKKISSKYLYNKKGSELFEEICSLEEYYITQSELSILKKNQKQIAEIITQCSALSPNNESKEFKKICLIEPGAGIGLKVKYLLKNISKPLVYVPIEISKSILNILVEDIKTNFPQIKVHPILADFNLPHILKRLLQEYYNYKKILFFPGSTIGNFELRDALNFIYQTLNSSNPTPEPNASTPSKVSGILLGVDIIKKDLRIIENAYNDKKGVTAKFNLNLLTRMNQELSTNFDLNKFEHFSFFNSAKSRIEMHIKSLEDQVITIGKNKEKIYFKKNETIHTENSYKYNLQLFNQNLKKLGLNLKKIWYDDKKLFAFCYITKN